MIAYSFGACIGYQIFIAELIQYVARSAGLDVDFVESIEFRAIVNVPIAALILLPLSLKRDMSSLAFAGMMSVIALFYTLLVVIVETPFYFKEYVNKSETQIFAFYIDWNFMGSCSLVFFAYTCQMSLLPIYSELVAPNYRRISKVVWRSLILDFVFYVLIASCGYLSTFNWTKDIVIDRTPLPAFDPDYFILASSVTICLVLLAAFAMNYNPPRNQFFLLCYKTTDYSNKANFIATVSFVSITCTAAVVYPNVSSVLSIMGGLCSVSICYTVPRKYPTPLAFLTRHLFLAQSTAGSNSRSSQSSAATTSAHSSSSRP